MLFQERWRRGKANKILPLVPVLMRKILFFAMQLCERKDYIKKRFCHALGLVLVGSTTMWSFFVLFQTQVKLHRTRTAILSTDATGGAWLLNLPSPRHATEWNNLHFVWMCLLCVTQRTSTLHLRCTSTAPPLHPTCTTTSPCCIVIIPLELHSQLTEVRFNCNQPPTFTLALARPRAMHTRETHYSSRSARFLARTSRTYCAN